MHRLTSTSTFLIRHRLSAASSGTSKGSLNFLTSVGMCRDRIDSTPRLSPPAHPGHAQFEMSPRIWPFSCSWETRLQNFKRRCRQTTGKWEDEPLMMLSCQLKRGQNICRRPLERLPVLSLWACSQLPNFGIGKVVLYAVPLQWKRMHTPYVRTYSPSKLSRSMSPSRLLAALHLFLTSSSLSVQNTASVSRCQHGLGHLAHTSIYLVSTLNL